MVCLSLQLWDVDLLGWTLVIALLVTQCYHPQGNSWSNSLRQLKYSKSIEKDPIIWFQEVISGLFWFVWRAV